MVGDHARQEAARAVVPTKLVLGPEPCLRAGRPVSVCTRHAIEATASRRDSRAAPHLQQDRGVDDGRVRRAGAVEEL